MNADLRATRTLVRREIHATAADLRAWKRHWRTRPDERGDPPACAFDLWRSKRRATLLCMIMAHSRRRLHLRLDGLPAQRALVEEELARLEAMRVGTPLLGEELRGAARVILAAVT